MGPNGEAFFFRRINDNYFDLLGVSRKEIIDDLKTSKIKHTQFLSDIFDVIYCYINLRFKTNIIFASKNKWLKNKKLT